jgi:hypothetical protein
MDEKSLDLVARTERNVAEGQRRIVETHALIVRLDPESADAAIAQAILRSHLSTQAILESHLADLRRVLAQSQRRQPSGRAGQSEDQRPTGQESGELA